MVTVNPLLQVYKLLIELSEREEETAADSTRQDVTATALDQTAQAAQPVKHSTRRLKGQKRGAR